jgi:hypothetical protein
VKVLLVVALIALVPLVLALLFWPRRASDGRELQQRAAEARELEDARELIDRLLEAAVDHRDVDPVLAPIVIDEIRAHQRSLRRRRDDGSS